MNFPNYFADANSSYNDADIVIFGIPFDKTSSFRYGARNGPDEIRKASWNFETYNIRTGIDLKNKCFHDYGNINVSNKDTSESMIQKVRGFTTKLLAEGKFPVLIGGEHSVTYGSVLSYPKDTMVVLLDAHMDFREKYENNTLNHACVTKRISDYLTASNIIIMGVRSAEKQEYHDAKINNIFFIDSYKINKDGIEKSLNNIKKKIYGKKIYLSIDIDVIDPAFAPGTSTPEPFGLNPFDILKCIDLFSPQLVGFDVMEVCPDYDAGQTSLLAAKIIRTIIENINF